MEKSNHIQPKQQDVEAILRKLFPEQDEEWINLSSIIEKEKNFIKDQ